MMPAYGELLTPEQVGELVKHVRGMLGRGE